MQNEKLQNGDVVRALVDGAYLLMTIEVLSANLELATCYWFDTNGRKVTTLHTSKLEKVAASDQPAFDADDNVSAQSVRRSHR